MSATINTINKYDHYIRTGLYGLLYNYYAITDARGITPAGWHIPLRNELTILNEFLGTEPGGKLKEIGTSNWQAPNTDASDAYGFKALPAGYRTVDGTFINLGQSLLIPSVEWNVGTWLRHCEHNSNLFPEGLFHPRAGYSVRLIRDSLVGWNVGDTIIDYDGNVYTTVQIGTQAWTVQNLAVTHYNNKDVITEVTENSNWIALATSEIGGLCAYNNDWSNVYARLL